MLNNNEMKFNVPFGYLDKLLNLLIIEDDPHFSCFLQELFEPVTLFNVHSASKSSEALDFIKNGKRVHICILDLGISDVANDEFYILRICANICPVLVLTGSRSPSKGAVCIQLGAKAVMEKGAGFSAEKLFDEVIHHNMVNIICKNYNNSAADTVKLAVQILFEKKPLTVTQWAEFMRITDRQLRNLWNIGSPQGAKFILEIFHQYSDAFRYFKSVLFSQKSDYCYGSSEKKSSMYLESHIENLIDHLS